MTREKKLKRFAELLEHQQRMRLIAQDLGCKSNLNNCRVSIKPGNKYTKVNKGDSGKYMVDAEGNIWGIKGYGQVHKGHHYGTLDTIDDYYWGEYTGYKISSPQLA